MAFATTFTILTARWQSTKYLKKTVKKRLERQHAREKNKKKNKKRNWHNIDSLGVIWTWSWRVVVVVMPEGHAWTALLVPLRRSKDKELKGKNNLWNVETYKNDQPRTRRVLFINWKMWVLIGNCFLLNEIKGYPFQTSYRPSTSILSLKNVVRFLFPCDREKCQTVFFISWDVHEICLSLNWLPIIF